MARYYVTYTELVTKTCTVEANSIPEAKEKFQDEKEFDTQIDSEDFHEIRHIELDMD